MQMLIFLVVIIVSIAIAAIIAKIQVNKKITKATTYHGNSATIIQQTASPAEELKKMKELLDMGILTQEEFDAKKKQLLGLPNTYSAPATPQNLGKCVACGRENIPVETIEVVVAGVSRKRIMCSTCAGRLKQPFADAPPQQGNNGMRVGDGLSYIQQPTKATNYMTKPSVPPQTPNQRKRLHIRIGIKFGIAAMLGILCIVFLSNFVFGPHNFGKTDYAPNCQNVHSWNAGVCEYCSMNCIEEIGKIILSNPDQVTADNAYVKSYLTKDLCPSVKDGDLLYNGALGVGYLPESNTLVLEFAYHGGVEISQMIAINGTVAKYYTYQFRHDNRAYGGSYDYLSGQFNANTLKDTTSFSYTEANSTVPSALKYFIDGHQKEACNFTKLLVKALNGFCEQHNLPFDAHELGFTLLTDSE